MDEPRLNPALESIQELTAFRQLLQAVPAGEELPNLGLARAARLPTLVALHARLRIPILLVTDRTDRALGLMDDLALWAPGTRRLLFPEPNPLYYENAPWGENTRRDRLQALTALAVYHLPPGLIPLNGPPSDSGEAIMDAPIIVAPTRALMTRSLPRRDFLKAAQSLRPGVQVRPDSLFRHWFRLGYEPVNTVIAPGQCARRGGILDIWPPADPVPSRMDFFGDEIDSLRPFDPASQRTLPEEREDGPRRILVTPAREFLLPEENVVDHPAGLRSSGQDPEARGEPDPDGTGLNEFCLPLLHPTPASILDYLPREGLVVIDNWEAFQDTFHLLEEQAVGLREENLSGENIPEDFPLPYLTWPHIEDTIAGRQSLALGPASASLGSELAQSFTPNPRFGGRLKLLLEHLAQVYHLAEPCVVVSRQSARLCELWDEHIHTQPGLRPPEFVQGSLNEGWRLIRKDGLQFHLLTDGEIFGWRRPQPRQRPRPVTKAPEASYADMQIGDWVVHIDHGIGRYRGLVSREIDGHEREYLCVEYAAGDELFVPVHQADRLTRYIGSDNRPPTPSRLGGSEWRSVKGRVKKAVEEVATDLLELYATRETIAGHAFGPDTPWQRELEASFPYIETEDQQRVIAEVKQDMEAPRPMDRLICGDVGYGKTEVALRAAFKAVMDGKQVAVLVPTTVLAQQHYHTFRDRLSAFPVELEMLSRFRTSAQQRDILFRLANGALDIVIGTHRLLQSDVAFKDLGLLVIDEEQRFGVTHKEFLKRMRTEVDVLTMTATPIPRTLYMTLTGVRDISMITTPPEERLPIVTHVGAFSKRLVRQAVLRELDRGGQVFFVHNRVQTIRAVRNQLSRLVPEARIAIAHGQMPEQQLAERMDQFTNGDLDILLTTSIIESGLDIPNANTLIVDRADMFGLAQLYQLRGRVGRGAQRAYAYFFRHKRHAPTGEGRQRMETIAENTQLGAGFSIAMRDLEIRGAGDILGTRQHGQIAAVGFHLYTRLLAEAVQEVRSGRRLPRKIEALSPEILRPIVSVDLPLPASIPPFYVADQAMRLRLYRRMADLRSPTDIDALAAEFADRFGPPPPPVRNLFFQLKVKSMAETAGLISVSSENGQIVLRFPPLPEKSLHRNFPPLGPHVRASKNALWLNRQTGEDWPSRLLEILARLGMQNQPG